MAVHSKVLTNKIHYFYTHPLFSDINTKNNVILVQLFRCQKLEKLNVTPAFVDFIESEWNGNSEFMQNIE